MNTDKINEQPKNAKKVELQVANILSNGNFRLDFSETLYDIENLMAGGKNITLLNEYKDMVLELQYNNTNSND